MITFKACLGQILQLKAISIQASQCTLQNLRASIAKKFAQLPMSFRLGYSVDRRLWNNLQSQSDMKALLSLGTKYVKIIDFQPSTRATERSSTIHQQGPKYQTAKPPQKEEPKLSFKLIHVPPASKKQEKPNIQINIKKDKPHSKLDISLAMINQLIEKVEKQMKDQENQHKAKLMNSVSNPTQKKQQQKSHKILRQKDEKKPEKMQKIAGNGERISKEDIIISHEKKLIKPKQTMSFGRQEEPRRIVRNQYDWRQERREEREELPFQQAAPRRNVVRETVEEVYRNYPQLNPAEFDKLYWIVEEYPYFTCEEIYLKYQEARRYFEQ